MRSLSFPIPSASQWKILKFIMTVGETASDCGMSFILLECFQIGGGGATKIGNLARGSSLIMNVLEDAASINDSWNPEDSHTGIRFRGLERVVFLRRQLGERFWDAAVPC
ncbi:hypothetical protein CDAR_123361 [Caerostris darwini]|uniref:Uncharacterized protein n=1 Tax=Caerostris darwini TaxID=1538125 RepID=A0AAV4RZH4_9ARAC|nr:hypothetical protein CDAR_123361 [Caerostris darwini]